MEYKDESDKVTAVLIDYVELSEEGKQRYLAKIAAMYTDKIIKRVNAIADGSMTTEKKAMTIHKLYCYLETIDR